MTAGSVIQTIDLVKDHCRRSRSIPDKRSSQAQRTRALDGLSLQVRAGEIFGLLGVNGAGKTTCIKLLLGLIKPTSGTCTTLGLPPGDLKALSQIGYLPENPRFYPHLTAHQTLDFFARLLNFSSEKRRQRIDELLGSMSLGDTGDKPVGAFSKGMVQRLALAQCLLNDPPVLFLDEPNSGLDPVGRRDMRQILQQLKQKGTTILLNSHLLPDVSELCDRIAILHDGKLAAEAATKEISPDGDHRRLEEFFMERIAHAQSGRHST